MKELIGIKESDTGLSLPSQWDLVSDKQMMQVCGLRLCGTYTYIELVAFVSTWGAAVWIILATTRTTPTTRTQEEQPLQVARCTKIINPGQDVRGWWYFEVSMVASALIGTRVDGRFHRPTTFYVALFVGHAGPVHSTTLLTHAHHHDTKKPTGREVRDQREADRQVRRGAR